MAENKIQTRFERMIELNNNIEELEEFIKKEKEMICVNTVVDVKYKLTFFNWAHNHISEDIPKVLIFEIFELARKKRDELKKEFDELNSF